GLASPRRTTPWRSLPEGPSDLLGDAHAAEARIATLQRDDGGNEFRGRALGAGFAARREKEKSQRYFRSTNEDDILAVWLDGIVDVRHRILGSVGVDDEGSKQLPGLKQGWSETARVAKDVLCDLIERGISPDRVRLFVVDGSKALRAAIEELFGDQAKVQRCRIHKMRNVTERLPKPIAAQVRAVMHAAQTLREGWASSSSGSRRAGSRLSTPTLRRACSGGWRSPARAVA